MAGVRWRSLRPFFPAAAASPAARVVDGAAAVPVNVSLSLQVGQVFGWRALLRGGPVTGSAVDRGGGSTCSEETRPVFVGVLPPCTQGHPMAVGSTAPAPAAPASHAATAGAGMESTTAAAMVCALRDGGEQQMGEFALLRPVQSEEQHQQHGPREEEEQEAGRRCAWFLGVGGPPRAPSEAATERKAMDAAEKRLADALRGLPGPGGGSGLRILRQDPWECLVSFLVSSNNTIHRIQKLLAALRRQCGPYLLTLVPKPDTDPGGAALGDLAGWDIVHRPPTAASVESAVSAAGATRVEPAEDGSMDFFAFPSLQDMFTHAGTDEQTLREMGMGYRAKFIARTCDQVRDKGGDAWLQQLVREEDRQVVQNELIDLHGVGRKVADCIALYSLEQPSVVPVDTHVWEIACRDFDPTLRETKSFTPTVYERVGALFRERYGDHAGWVQSVLFASELPQFKPTLPAVARKPRKKKTGSPSSSNKSKRGGGATSSTKKKTEHGAGSAATDTTRSPADSVSAKRKRARSSTSSSSSAATTSTPASASSTTPRKKSRQDR